MFQIDIGAADPFLGTQTNFGGREPKEMVQGQSPQGDQMSLRKKSPKI
jgi:hypothetical protein